MNSEIIYKEIEFEGKKLSLETGKLAKMSNMAVKASYGDTVVLVTVVSGGLDPETDFFPLTVNYQEKYYASGRVKNSRYQKRDGRGTDDAVIAGRVIDHAIRPLFPSDFMDEVQIISTVLSYDEECDPKYLSMIATSAALHASDVPWDGPMATLNVGYINGDYVLSPTRKQLSEQSELDMTISFVGKDKRFLALEAEANILSEEKILGAIEHARNKSDVIFNFVSDFAKAVNPKAEKYEYTSKALGEDVYKAVSDVAEAKIKKLMKAGMEKDELEEKLDSISEEVYSKLEGKFKKLDMTAVITDIKKNTLQNQILETEKRPDGRGIKEIRPLSGEVGFLPRTHGSALFTRGITQSLTTATLASPALELLIEDMRGESSKRYMHHYNFPPFSGGVTGKVGFPKNREIGHGMIGENGLRPVIPSQKDFPYTILVTTEILSSSGSTSMAATCGSTLALMDAGVPIKDMVGGIGVGLIANEDFSQKLIVTDLAYMEDAFGLLDFKMTGTETGVTAIQCDMKSPGIPFDLLPKIIDQSREGRLEVLKFMKTIIDKPRADVSAYAPKSESLKIEVDQIGMVIGTGGKTIKEIQERTDTEIAIEEDGTVVVSGINKENVTKAADIVRNMTREIHADEVFDGVVEEVVDFGAFVEILPGKVGLLHISELSNGFVNKVEDILKAGDTVKVKVLEVGRDGKISLSKKALEEGYVKRERPAGRGGRGGFDRGPRAGRGRSDRDGGHGGSSRPPRR